MSGNQQAKHDPLEEAIEAFQRMTVPERPSDAGVLAQLGTRRRDAAQPVSTPSPSKRRYLMRLLVPSTAAALILIGALGLFLLNSTPPVALADVIKAAEQHKLVRVKKTQVTETTDTFTPRGELTSTEYWDLKAPRTRSESRVGDDLLLDIQDEVNGRQLMMNSKNKTGTLFIRNAKNLSFLDNLKKLQERKETTSGKDTLDGHEVVRYSLKEGDNTTTLWVDRKTKLPIRMEYEMINPTPNITLNKWTWTDFEWDPELKEVNNLDELFSTKPPKDYNISEIDKTREDQ